MSAQATHELLRRYLRGDLTAPEEVELERRADQDPILAEAMTGLRSVPEADHIIRVQRMLASVREQSEPAAKVRQLSARRRVRRPVYAAAAAALLLLGAIALWPRLMPQESATELALEEPAPSPSPERDDITLTPEPAPTEEPAVVNTPPANPASTSPSSDPRPRPQEETVVPEAELDVVVEEATNTAPPPPPTPLPTPSVTPPELEDNSLEEAAATAHAAADRQAQERQKRRERFQGEMAAASEAGSRLVIGRITDSNGEPIDRALVRLPGLPLGQRTDTSGIFRMEVDAVASLLEISHPDYEAEKFTLPKQNEDLQITLEQKDDRPPLDGSETWSVSKVPIDDGPGYAVPEEGFGDLRKRIEANRPAEVPKGKVKVSFLVDPDGTLSDFVFRGKPSQATMDYVGETIMNTSIWRVYRSEEAVRVYFKVVFK